MSKLKKGIVIGLSSLAIMSGVVATGCDGCNRNVWGIHEKLNYIVIEENGHNVLHEIDKWNDSESEAVMVTTKCCGNYIWASVNNAVVYRDKPDISCYDYECGHAHENE